MPKTDTLIKASDKAPDFKLRNYDGTEYTLSTLLKDTNLLLLFFRGTWCPNCRKQLLSLSSVNADFQRLGTQLVGVFCQKAEPVKQWATENHIPFPLLIDAERQAAKDYGVYVRISYDSFNIARPSNFLIDRSGVVRYVYVSSHQWDRCDNDRLLEEARKL